MAASTGIAWPELIGVEELQLAAVEARIEADLALGRHRELVAELEALVRIHPLREHLHGQLMLALYRCGRQADALAAYRAARILVTAANFGCGSSREHAPQALMRWGIRAIVGGSFGEIFFGNCVMLGIPCLVASQADLEWLQKAVERSPKETVSVDVEKQEVRFGDKVIQARIPDGPRNQLVQGTWDSTAVLLEAGNAIETTA